MNGGITSVTSDLTSSSRSNGSSGSFVETMKNPKIREAFRDMKKILAIMWSAESLNGWWAEFSKQAFKRFCLLLMKIAVNVAASYPLNWFMTALSNKDEASFYRSIAMFGVLAIVASPIVAVDKYFHEKVYLKLRVGVTTAMLDSYHSNQNFYRLLNATTLDNPGQRICDDADWVAWGITSISVLIVYQSLQMVAWTVVLMNLTAGLLPYVIFAAITAVALSILTVGKPLMKIAYKMSHGRAEFRTGITRTRDNAETICFYNAEKFENTWSTERMEKLIDDSRQFAAWRSVLTLINDFSYYSSSSLPYLLMAPLLFQGKIQFGALSQASVAFTRLLGTMTVIIYELDEISKIHAGCSRVCEFFDTINARENQERAMCSMSIAISPRRITPGNVDGNTRLPIYQLQMKKITREILQKDSTTVLEIDNLTYVVPERQLLLVSDLNLQLVRGDRLVIVGPSGCGKSSLLRVIRGLWRMGAGVIRTIPESKYMFLPQKPYLPVLPELENTLKAQLLFPSSLETITDSEAESALRQVNMSYLMDCDGITVNDCADWSKKLSLGEQQRLAFARMLLQKPDLVFLDEATSALDDENQSLMYKVLQNRNMTYISVAHRMSIMNEHSRVLELTGDGGFIMDTVDSYLNQHQLQL